MGNTWSSLRNNPPLLPIQAPPPAAMPIPLPAPYDHNHAARHANVVNGRYPYGPIMEPPPPPPPPPSWQLPPQRPPPPIQLQPPSQRPWQPPPPRQLYVECPNATTIRNGFTLRKETLRIEPDEANTGKDLVTFTFDATVAVSITVIFFAKEGEDCSLTPTTEGLRPPITVHFQQGLAQKFKQPSGTGIAFSMFEEAELSKDRDMDIYPLAVKAEKSGNSESASVILAVFKKDRDEYRVKVVKQILWRSRKRYELQVIYGHPGEECDICFSQPRDTIALPCRHMSMCSKCVKNSGFDQNSCPICRQQVEHLVRLTRLTSYGAQTLRRTISVGYALCDRSRISVVSVFRVHASACIIADEPPVL